MRNIYQVLILTILLGVFSVVGAYAAEKNMGTQEAIEYSKKAELATSVITLGEEKKDAILLMSGVKLLDELPSPVVKPGQTGKNVSTYDRGAILEMAKTFAGKNKNLLEVIADLKADMKRDVYDPRYGCWWGWSPWRGYGCWVW